MRWCVQNLSTFNDGTIYSPVSMISNLTETIMCLIEETGDSTHERTGRGELGAATFLPSPSLPKFWATQVFLGSNRNFGKTNFYKSFHVSFRLFFFQSNIFLF